MVIRISFSNLFKEFKSTSTWLQFPYTSSLTEKENRFESGANSSEKKDKKPALQVRWTLLTLDLKAILSQYLHSNYAYLKNVKLCSSLLVKNVFTSDIEYSPLATTDGARTPSGESIIRYVQPLPKEMTFTLTRGSSFVDVYDYIRFPPESPADHEQLGPVLSHAHLKGHNPAVTSIVEDSSDDLEAQVRTLKLASSTVQSLSTGVAAGEKLSKEVSGSQTKSEEKKSHKERSRAKENMVHVSHKEGTINLNDNILQIGKFVPLRFFRPLHAQVTKIERAVQIAIATYRVARWVAKIKHTKI